MFSDDSYIRWIVDFDTLASSRYDIKVIDFDPCGATEGFEPRSSSSSVRELFDRAQKLTKELSQPLSRKLKGHVALLCALVGQRVPIDFYVEMTMGLPPRRFDEDAIKRVLYDIGAVTSSLGISKEEFLRVHNPVDEPIFEGDLVVEKFRERFDILRLSLEREFGLRPDFKLDIQRVDVDAYWTYWVDGTNGKYRLRLNRSSGKKYRESEIDQFVLHELVAHCSQMAAWQNSFKAGDLGAAEAVTSVHTWEQPLLEGIAQALPLMMNSSDLLVQGRALRELLRQTLLNNIYIAIESGENPLDLLRFYSDFLYIEDEERFLRNFFQYQNNPQLRCYMYAYPLGFMSIFENYISGSQSSSALVRAAFSRPMILNQEGIFENA